MFARASALAATSPQKHWPLAIVRRFYMVSGSTLVGMLFKPNCNGAPGAHAHVPADDVHRFPQLEAALLGVTNWPVSRVRLARVRGADHSATICLSPAWYALECVNFFWGKRPQKDTVTSQT